MNELVDKIELSEQISLLEQAKEHKGDLPDTLKEKEITYDALRYEEYCELPKECLAPIETLDSIEKGTDKIPAVSFFSGAGGFDVGFSYAGFENLISIEFNEVFCNTLRANNPDKVVIGPPHYSGDISKREELAEILMKHGITENFPGVFHGGPPCQSFSIAANQRFSKDDDNFKRKGFDDEEKGTLIFDYIWIHLLDTERFPLLDRTLRHSFVYLFLRLMVEKTSLKNLVLTPLIMNNSDRLFPQHILTEMMWSKLEIVFA